MPLSDPRLQCEIAERQELILLFRETWIRLERCADSKGWPESSPIHISYCPHQTLQCAVVSHTMSKPSTSRPQRWSSIFFGRSARADLRIQPADRQGKLSASSAAGAGEESGER